MQPAAQKDEEPQNAYALDNEKVLSSYMVDGGKCHH
jgi:hypothetical protein